jgi:hypothetical protein
MESLMPTKRMPAAASSRIRAAAASLLLVFAAMLAAPAEVRALTTAGGINYTIADGEVTITGCAMFINVVTHEECYGSDLEIPDTIDGHPVTAIQEWAFYGIDLIGVTLPSTLQEIGKGAFLGNPLKELNLPSSLVTIGEAAFSLNHIRALFIPDSVTSIGPSAFSGNNFTSLRLSNSLTVIEDEAFNGGKITSLTIPSSVTSIGSQAFGSQSLTSITIPGTVKTIGDYAFISNRLKSVTIENGVTSIGESAFAGGVPEPSSPKVNAITTVIIAGSVTSIGRKAFYWNKINSAVFLGNAPTGGKDVFGHNPDLNKVMRPYGASGWGSKWSGISVGISDIQASATVKPSVTGTAAVNETLTAAKGTWAGYPSPAFTYQWYACTDAVLTAQSTVPVSCTKISGATKSTVKLKSAQQGKYIAVQVTGKSSRTAAVAWLSPTTVVVP